MIKKQRIAVLLLLVFVFQMMEGYTSVFAAKANDNLSIWIASTKDVGVVSEFGSTYDHGKVLYAMIDGETAYCMNYAKSADSGQNMISSSSPQTSLTSTQKKYLNYCMYYGFRATNTSGPSEEQRNKYIATQAMVWIIEKDIFDTSSANSAARKICASAPDSSESYDYYVSLKEKMLSAMEVKQASFSEVTKASAKTYELEWNEDNGQYETTLTDTNKVLSKYNLSLDSYKSIRNGNKLTIYSKSAVSGTVVGKLTANDDIVNIIGNCVYWRVTGGNSSYQEFVSSVPECEKVLSYFKVKTKAVGYGEIIKRDSSTGTVLANAVYGIYRDKSCTDLVEKLTTDKKGYAKSSALDVGTYYVKEIKAPENYVISLTVSNLEVKADKVTTLTVTDKGQKGNLVIYKEGQVLTGWNGTDFVYETGYLSGAEFMVKAGENIYCADGKKKYAKGDIVAKSLMTGADGKVTLDNLELGTYIISEVNAPDGYKLNPVEKSVTISYKGQTEEVSYASTSITNTRQKAKVKVEKEDAETLNPLANAEFGVYAATNIKNSSGKVIVQKDTLLETVITGSDGIANFSVDLPVGASYYVKETKAPEGYEIKDEIYKFTFKHLEQSKASVTFTHTFQNTRVTGQISLQKVDRETNSSQAQGYGSLEGAVYGLYARQNIVHPDGNTSILYKENELVEMLITDELGQATVSGLYLGSYYLKEMKAPTGYVLSEEEIDVILEYEGQTVLVVAKDITCSDMPVTVEFQKVDKDTQKNIAGAKLCLLDENETILESWITNTEENHVVKGLEIGKSYILREESAPYGYLKAEEIRFIIKDTEEVQTIVMEDAVPTGAIILNKYGELLNTVDPVKANGGLISYLFGYIKGNLQGVTFELYADEDIFRIDGEQILYKKGDLVATLVTDEKGIASVSDLPLGNYFLVETETADGYVMDSTPILIELTYQNQDTEIIYAGFGVENARQRIKATVTKSDAVTGERLEGVVFGLYAREDILNAVNQVILQADTLIETAVTNEKGIAEFLSDLPLGSYYVKEIQAKEGYALSKERFEFVAEYQGSKIEVVEIHAEFINHPTKVRITKTDSSGQNNLFGAELSLFNSEGEVIERWVSTEKGHVIERLPIGSYTLREEKAPFGYVIAQDILFEVEDTEEIQEVIMKDDTAKGKIFLYKTDRGTGEPLEGVEFEIRSADGTVLETLVTDENGFAESREYEIGRYENGEFAEHVKYYLVETKALDGYVLSDEAIEIVFDYVDGETEVLEYVVEVSNSKKIREPELPKTGDTWGWWWIVGGSIVIFYMLIRKQN